MEHLYSRVRAFAAMPVILVVATACGGGSNPGFAPPSLGQTSSTILASRPAAGDTTSLLKTLKEQVVIGTVVDPKSGAANPYGLTVVPFTSGKLTAGDLLVCNFNAKSGVQGTGKSIVAIHPKPGSKPVRSLPTHRWSAATPSPSEPTTTSGRRRWSQTTTRSSTRPAIS